MNFYQRFLAVDWFCVDLEPFYERYELTFYVEMLFYSSDPLELPHQLRSFDFMN